MAARLPEQDPCPCSSAQPGLAAHLHQYSPRGTDPWKPGPGPTPDAGCQVPACWCRWVSAG